MQPKEMYTYNIGWDAYVCLNCGNIDGCGSQPSNVRGEAGCSKCGQKVDRPGSVPLGFEFKDKLLHEAVHLIGTNPTLSPRDALSIVAQVANDIECLKYEWISELSRGRISFDG